MLTNFWSKLKEKFSMKILIPYIIIVLLIGVGYYFYNRNAALGEKLDAETKFRIALVDSVKYYKNAYNEVTAEKKTLQLDLKELNKNLDTQINNLRRTVEDFRNQKVIAIESNKVIKSIHEDIVTLKKQVQTEKDL